MLLLRSNFDGGTLAVKSVVVSDVSGVEVPDDKHARVVVEHPDQSFAIELDVSAEEADKFQNSSLRLVTVTVYAPNVSPRKAVVETKTLDKLFGATVDFDAVLASGRRADRPAAAPARRAIKASSPSAEKRDYKAMDNIGLEHRGRVTEEEARLVRENLSQANENRAREGQAPIDPKDAKMVKRYGFK